MSRPRLQRGHRLPILSPRVKIWLESAGNYAFGYGISVILEAIDQAGSIKQAARDLGKSYRHVWSRVKEAERALGCTLVDTQVGGTGTQRSFLTATARRLVDAFIALRARIHELVEREFARHFHFLKHPTPPNPDSTRP